MLEKICYLVIGKQVGNVIDSNCMQMKMIKVIIQCVETVLTHRNPLKVIRVKHEHIVNNDASALIAINNNDERNTCVDTIINGKELE